MDQTGQGTRPYYFRKKKNAEAIANFSGYTLKGFPGLRAIPVRVRADQKIRVSKNGEVSIKDTFITRRVYLFSAYFDRINPGAENPIVEAAHFIAEQMVKDKIQFARPITGGTEANPFEASSIEVSPDRVVKMAAQFTGKYGNSNLWFFGFVGYGARNQQSEDAYKIARAKAMTDQKRRAEMRRKLGVPE